LFKHGAVVLNKNRIISKGFNSLKTNPQLKKKYNYWSIHAESQAIMRANKGDTILVVRILKDGSLTCSKPCDKCIEHARDNGIKKIYYSNWNGEIESLKL
jgi:deoxycytidylate deaminase